MTEAWGPDDDEPRAAPSGRCGCGCPRRSTCISGWARCGRDGYHELNTVYHAICLFDELTARPGRHARADHGGRGRRRARARRDQPGHPGRARARRAYAGVPPHARLHLRKQIPLAGGLAGGSADAAAALVACDALWGTGLSRDELAEIAADLGSDVPFLLLRRHRAGHRPRRGGQPHPGPPDRLALGGRDRRRRPVHPRGLPRARPAPRRPVPPAPPLGSTDALMARAAPARPRGARRRARQRPAARRAGAAPGAGRHAQGRRGGRRARRHRLRFRARPACSSPPTPPTPSASPPS